MRELFVTSILGVDHGPRVCIQTHSRDFQLSPEEARNFALSILEASEAAQSDECIFRFLTEEMGLDVPMGATVIREMRKYRRNPAADNEG